MEENAMGRNNELRPCNSRERRMELFAEFIDLVRKEYDSEKDLLKRIDIISEIVKSISDKKFIINELLKKENERLSVSVALNYYLFDEVEDILYKLMAFKERAEKEKDEKSIFKADKAISRIYSLEKDIVQALKFMLDPKKEKLKKGFGTHEAEIISVEFFDYHGKSTNRFRTGEPFTAKICYDAHKKIEKPMFGAAMHTKDGIHICGPNTTFSGRTKEFIEGKGCVTFSIDSLPLLEGEYLFSATLLNYEGDHPYDFHWKEFPFYVFGGGVREKYGIFYLRHEWGYD